MSAATPIRLAVALGLGALGGAWLLLPGTAERLAMLARDKSFERALQAGEAALGTGADDPETLARVFDINSHEGDPAPARRALLAYIRQRPDDRAMLWRGVEFMEESEDLAGLKDVLGHLASALGDPAAIERLARLHRLYGDYRAERALLGAGDPARLTPPMRWRLAALLAGEGAVAKSAALLEALDAERPATDADDRTLVFDTLLAAGRPQAAARHALRWTADGLDPAQRALFVLQLALGAAEAEALELVRAEGPGRFDATSLAWTLGTRGHLTLAERIIDTQLAGADPATLRRIMRLYADLGAATGGGGRALARAAALLDGSDPDGRRRGLLLASILFERQGYGAIAPLRARLTGERLGEAPLFAASLLLAERNAQAARRFLLLVDPGALGEAEARLFAQMSFELLGPAATLDVLDAHRRGGTLGANLLPALAEAARRTGRFEPAWAILRGSATPPEPTKEPSA